MINMKIKIITDNDSSKSFNLFWGTIAPWNKKEVNIISKIEK
jgi:hypothetical protein